MFETTETPQGDPAPEPQPAPTPESTPAPDAEEPTPEQQKAAADREGRRLAAVRARLGAAERLQEQQAAELAYWRGRAQELAPQPETQEQALQRIRAEARAEAEADIVKRMFHDAGRAQYPDWEQKTIDVQKMGADNELARLIVGMPDGEGVRVVAALADDPEALQRIAGVRGEQARAIALGKYAASIGDETPLRRGNGNAAPPREVTRAPAPVRPVTGRASPVFNEYTATTDQLADHYMRQNIEPANTEAVMPSKSKLQARTMQAAAHNPAFAKKVGIPVSVAKEFSAADEKRGTKRLPARKK